MSLSLSQDEARTCGGIQSEKIGIWSVTELLSRRGKPGLGWGRFPRPPRQDGSLGALAGLDTWWTHSCGLFKEGLKARSAVARGGSQGPRQEL
jgi:hypothetical protein